MAKAKKSCGMKKAKMGKTVVAQDKLMGNTTMGQQVPIKKKSGGGVNGGMADRFKNPKSVSMMRYGGKKK